MNKTASSGGVGAATLRRSHRLQTLVLILLAPGLLVWNQPLQANPHGGVVVHGDVQIGTGAGGNLQILQNSQSAIIDWQGFSISAGEITQFFQPGSNAAVLNRVTGGDPSAIHGALKANGNVFVINSSGILVGPGGSIDVNGLVLSTLDVDNGEFLARGDMVFKGGSDKGVTNLGRINAIGGDVFLIGRTVSNSGSVSAGQGRVGLAAGEEVLLKADTGLGGERVFVRATGAGASGTGIFNDGTIEGAAVELKAHGNLYALAINNKGSIRATGAANSGGRVYLRAAGGSMANRGSIRAAGGGTGSGGRVLIEAAYAKVDGQIKAEGGAVRIATTDKAEIGGSIDVSSSSVPSPGGQVIVEAREISVGGSARIDASGETGGGSIQIGGGFQGRDATIRNAETLVIDDGASLRADALASGNGGQVILWADGDTAFRGDVSAQALGSSGNGGFVEVSGKEGLLFDGTVSTLAESGANGTLLLDPRNLTISTATATLTNIRVLDLVNLLGTNHVVVSTLDPGNTTDAGHITVLDSVIYTSANSLTLLAEGDLYIGNHIINRDVGDVNLVAGWDPSVRSLDSLFGGSPGSPGSATLAGAPDMDSLIFGTVGSFGKGGGSVYVGLLGHPGSDPSLVAADRAVSVASRNGQTNVAGYDVNVWGPALTGGIETGQQRYAQIGYNRRAAGTTAADPNPVLGSIRVKAVNDVSVVANKHEVGALGNGGWTTGTINTGNASFAQIGHGGERDSVRGMKLSGEIIVEAGNDVSVLGGKGINNHAQIGHGGFDNTGTTNFTATLGGNITVHAGRDVTVVGGLGYLAFAQIGHGTFQQLLANFAESMIDVDAGRNVTVRGGAGTSGPENSTYARAQIGHGSHANDFVDAGGAVLAPGSGKGFKGAITVDAGGAILLEAGHYDSNNFAVIGHGGNASDGDHGGDVTVTAGTGLQLLSGTGADYLFAQIGHIAMNSANAISGDVRVIVEDGGVLLKGGGSTVGHAAIGSGGYVIGEGSTIGGGTYLTLKGAGGLVMESGNGTYSSAQIGHVAQRGAAGPAITLSGDVAVDVAAGGLTMKSSADGYFSQTMIGHGGRDVSGVKSGNIWVRVASGDISLLGGGAHASARYNSAQIGHGGYGNGTSGTISSGTGFADILDDDGNVVGQRRLGIVVTAEAGNIVLKGGLNDHSYAQIGHGGLSASAATVTNIGGDITVAASGQVLAEAGGTRTGNFALIGHGGLSNAGARSGDIRVTAGNGVDLLAGGTGGGALFAQVGHLSYGSLNMISGDVRVTVEDGRVLLRGGGSGASHAAIGSGGYNITGGSSISGGTYVTLKGTDATDGLKMESGIGSHAAAHIGHLAQRESLTTAIDLSGDVEVDVAAGGLSMQSSADGYFAHTMIGHGGREMAGGKSGDIRVTVVSGDLSVLAGGVNASLRYNHAQIGHGGYSNGGAMVASSGSGFTDLLDGDGNVVGQQPLGIVVRVLDGDIDLLAGKNGGSYAQIGHGGLRAGTANIANFTGDVTVEASGDIDMGQGTASYAYAQIGHGGPSSVANNVWNLGGAIAVTAGGSVIARGGSASITNVQIGHGGYATTTASSIAVSPITVKATTGDVLLLSGTASNTGAKIGHGGYNMKLSSFGESPVTVEAGRHVRLVSPQFETFTAVSNSGTQIGHGGFGATVGPVSGASTLGYSGDIAVTAGGKLDVIAGKNAGSYNWSLLGHTSYYNSNGVHSGSITVTTGTLAGLAPADYGITVQAAYGDYLPIATTNTTAGYYYSFASIGHRGHSNDSSQYTTGLHGDILVDAVRGGILVAGGDGVDGSTAADTPPDIRLNGASIGHGGYAAGRNGSTPGVDGISGSVSVFAEGGIVLRSGTSRNAAVMIGHGGVGAFGPMTGDITVVSRNGSLELNSTLAINTTRGGVMIGHGAPSPGAGTRQGDILVDVAGEISLVRTVANLSYIGHRTGTANAISNADVTIRGRSFDRVTGDSGSELFRPDAELATMLVNNLAGGNLSLVGMGNRGIEMDTQMLWTSAYDFNLLAYSDIFIANDLINRGDGDLNIFAGWNPGRAPLHASGDILPPLATAPPWRGYLIRDIDADAQLFDVPGAYGNGGSVYVGAYADLSAADRSVAVASRAGQTNVAGHDVNVWGPAYTGGINQGAQRYAQIGYNRRDAGTATTLAATGRLRVGAVNDINVVANYYEVGIRGSSGWIATTDNTGNASFAQIGHGGERDSVRDMELSGDIVVEAGGNLSLLGGLAYNNHATIGHGGYDNRDTTFPGVASIKGGDISVTAGGDVTLQAGLGYHANVQIGHGGGQVILSDFVESKITVSAGGDVMVRGGAGVAGTESNSRAQAQIGHGGYDADFVDPTTGDVRTAGSGYGYKGDIEVTAGGAVLVEAGNHDANNLAAIGNGGIAADGDHSGAITVTAGAGVELRSGTGSNYNLAQIGHFSHTAHGDLSGEITVTALGGALVLQSVDSIGNANPVMIGHGGILSNGKRTGAITATAANGVSVLAGSGADTLFAQIGHLSYRSLNEIDGHVTVISQDGGIRLQGGGLGNKAASYAVIGNSGGYDPTAGTTISGDTKVVSLGTDPEDGIVLKSGSDSYSSAHIGHLAQRTGPNAAATPITLSGDVVVEVAAGGLLMQSASLGSYSHTMIGHGGRDISGDKSGNVWVDVLSGDISLLGGGSDSADRYNHAQIGHGGYGNGVSGTYSSPGATVGGLPVPGIRVAAHDGAIEIRGGQSGFGYAMIGHGGAGIGGTNALALSGAIEVSATGGSVTVAGGDRANATAQIGHGGRIYSIDTPTGDSSITASPISVTATGDVLLLGGTTSYTSAKIGHGGTQLKLSSFGESPVTVNAGRHLRLVSPQFDAFKAVSYSSAHIGHGGVGATVGGGDSGYSGDIVVNAGGKLDLLAAKNAQTHNYALIGHTAYFNVRGSHSGDITVKTGLVGGLADYGIDIVAGNRDVSNAANSYYSYAGIGHRGHKNSVGGGDLDGNITVIAERGGLRLKGGDQADGNAEVRLHAAQIGHGDYNSDGLKTGNIKVSVDGDILLENGDARQSPVQIGHGGFSHDGNITGSIEVSSLNGSITLDSSVGNNDITNTQIGHGGSTTTGTFNGYISVSAAGDIQLRGGRFDASHAQIGHGGDASNGNFGGNIHLLAGGGLSLTGGTHVDAFAMVGHGSARPHTTGTRSGEMKLFVGDATVLTDNVSGTRLGHGTTTSGGIGNAGITLVSGTLDLSKHARRVTDIANEMGQSGEVTFAIMDGDLLVDGGAVHFNHGFNTNFVASGNVTMATTVQNVGSGNVGVAAGWDAYAGYDPATGQFDGGNGLTFEMDFSNSRLMQTLEFDLGALAADPSLWGNGGKVIIGSGSQTAHVAVGSARGNTMVLGHSVDLTASATGHHAQIGSTPAAGVSPNGDITVKAKEGGVSLSGGDIFNAYAQIGHRASGAAVPNLAGEITVESGGDLDLLGGDGALATAQIGHGGPHATVTSIGGGIEVTVDGDMRAVGGVGGGVQVGHGGYSTDGAMSGLVKVEVDGSILLSAPGFDAGAYAKIGHGDDLADSLGSGTGTRAGDIEVTAGTDFTMMGALMGHVNSTSSATFTGSPSTFIGVSWNDPGNLAGGSLIADANSEFSGTEVRFYLPRRGNNQVAAGALINGEVYDGGVDDPQWDQRLDEYTDWVVDEDGNVLDNPGERGLGLGDGLAPTALGSYAFYYDTIVYGEPVVVNPGPGPGPDPGPGPGPGLGGNNPISPEDRTFHEGVDEQVRKHTSPVAGGIRYRGYHQYGPNGESVYSFHGASPVEEPRLAGGGDEDELRRRLQALRQQTEGEGGSQAQSQEEPQEETQPEAPELAAESNRASDL